MRYEAEVKDDGPTDIVLLPTFDSGRFLIDTGSIGERVVSRISLQGIREDERVMLARGERYSVLAEYVELDAFKKGTFNFVRGGKGETTVDVPHTDNSVTVELTSFVELVPLNSASSPMN